MILKNIFDRVVSAISLLLLLPLMLIIAILLKFKMGDGPIVFKQQRVGIHGRIFTMYKFRTMIVNYNSSSISIAGESRITPLGASLRKYKLDELPELWNVLKGDMSLVGPRPDVPGYADKLKGEDRKILEIKPGITGPATIKYSNEEVLLSTKEDPIRYNDEVIFPDKVQINLCYYRNRSFILDLKILLKTFFYNKSS